MALVKGTNSYASVVEADAYFADRLDATNWSEADVSAKAQALIMATSILDDLSWTGIAVGDVLAFPREGSYFDPRLGKDVVLSGVPARVIRATYELAFHMLNNSGLYDETGGINDLKIGSLEIKRIRAPDRIPSLVHRLIKPLLINAGASSWWRAN